MLTILAYEALNDLCVSVAASCSTCKDQPHLVYWGGARVALEGAYPYTESDLASAVAEALFDLANENWAVAASCQNSVAPRS